MKNERISIAANRLTALDGGVCRSHLLLAIGVGLCCSAGLFLTAGSTLNQAGSLDPYIYAGYIHDYTGLLERFGQTYFSERIAYIYPERAFAHLFGLEGGYFAFRLVALASAVAAVFTIGMRFYGYAPAILAAVWLSFTPWLPRALLYTHYDGVAVVYLLIGAAFLFVPTIRRLTCHVVAGAAFALAVDCNLFLLAICGLLGPGWFFFYRREGIVWLSRTILALAVGFFGTYLALALLLHVQYPVYGFSFELSSITEAISLLEGEEQTWYRPLSLIIWEEHNFTLLIPITFMLAALAVVVRRSIVVRTPNSHAHFEVLAVSYLASIICLSLIFHFYLHSFWLSVPYYTIYFLPGCVLVLIVLGGEAERRGGRILGGAAVHIGTGLILLSWLALPDLPRFAIASSFYFWLMVAAVTVGAAVALRCAAASVVLVAGASLLSLCLYQNYAYEIRTASPERTKSEWDVFRGAIFLQQFVNANVRPSQSVGFWYSNKQEPRWQWLNSVQSMFLWNYTRVFSPSKDNPGMPLVDEQFRSAVAEYRFVVLLGLSDAETNLGLSALEAAKLPFREVKRTHFQGQLWGYTAVLIEMKPRTTTVGPLLFDVPIARLEPANDASISSLGNGLRLVTAARQWSYSLTGPLLPEQGSVQGAVVVRVRLQVEEGKVGVAVSSVAGRLIREFGVETRTELQEVYLDIPDVSAADLLIIRNQSPSGPSRAAVYSVDVFQPN